MEPKHRYPRGVTVSLATCDLEQKTFPEGRMNKAHRESGTVTWSGPIVHEIHNVGKAGRHSIRVELK
jgi:hypothetical protein